MNALIAALVVAPATLPPLHVVGKNLVDPSGKPVLLKGCNLGNWLINEVWMFGLSDRAGVPGDQYGIEQTLTKRFGKAEDLRLMNTFRESWMTERDWKNIQSFNFNLVRVPFNYTILEDDDQPMKLRPDAFRWLDKAVSEAESHGLYVILDLHGVQGGQTADQTTGRSGQNKLWDVPANQARMDWLWKEVAKHFRDRTSVIAYDPMNEPWGAPKTVVEARFEKVYAAIRTEDPEKLVLAHGATDNFDHFGDPKDHGWHNVGFQMHFYPGLFGDAPRIRSSLRHLDRLKTFDAKINTLNVPFLVGEMNAVLKSNGGAGMMRRYYDAHAGYGWMTTMWSYKVLTASGGYDGNGGWGMVTNAKPMPLINFEKDSKSDIESFMASFATQPLDVYEDLRKYLAEDNPKLPALPHEAAPRTIAPTEAARNGWNVMDLNGAMGGGLVNLSNGVFELYGAGEDIWNSSDQFRFMNRKVSGDFEVSVTLDAMEDTETYTKAGLMVRQALSPDSATVLLTVFPGGGTQVAERDAAGENMKGEDGPKGAIKGKLTIARRGNVLIFAVRGKEFARRTIPALSGPVYVGPIALSHNNAELTKVT